MTDRYDRYNDSLYSRYRFFKRHAGGIVGESALSAIHLARAEMAAEFDEVTYRWSEDDSQPYEDALGDHAYWCRVAQRRAALAIGARDAYVWDGEECCQHDVEGCTMLDAAGVPIGGLYAILDASAPGRRVIEAELALEHFGAIASFDVAS